MYADILKPTLAIVAATAAFALTSPTKAAVQSDVPIARPAATAEAQAH